MIDIIDKLEKIEKSNNKCFREQVNKRKEYNKFKIQEVNRRKADEGNT